MPRNVLMLVAVLAAAWLAACASQPDSDVNLNPGRVESLGDRLADRNLRVEGPANRIRDYRLGGWQYLDPHHVIINAGVNDKYLVTLRSYCFELDGAFRIGFTSTVGSIGPSDAIIVTSPGGYTERCSIRAIDRLVRTDRPAEDG